MSTLSPWVLSDSAWATVSGKPTRIPPFAEGWPEEEGRGLDREPEFDWMCDDEYQRMDQA